MLFSGFALFPRLASTSSTSPGYSRGILGGFGGARGPRHEYSNDPLLSGSVGAVGAISNPPIGVAADTLDTKNKKLRDIDLSFNQCHEVRPPQTPECVFVLLFSKMHTQTSLSIHHTHAHTLIGIMLIRALCSVTGEARAPLTGSVRLRAPSARFDRASPDSWD